MSETTIKTKDQVLGEIRYAQRLAQRTARLYRRIQAFSTFLAILGGAGVMSAMSTRFPVWVSISPCSPPCSRDGHRHPPGRQGGAE